MATEVIMPKVDMVMDTGTFVEWLKEEGDRVEKGEPIFIVLTDKANIEVESPGTGILAGITAKPNDVIPVTEVIAYILEPDESLPQKAAVAPVVVAAAMQLMALTPANLRLQAGENVTLYYDQRRIHLFNPQTSLRVG